MSKALHVRPFAGQPAPKKPAKAGKQRPKLALVPAAPKEPKALVTRSVEVFGRDGHLVDIYSVALEDDHDIAFEEVALIFAEQSGRVAKDEFVHLRARCV